MNKALRAHLSLVEVVSGDCVVKWGYVINYLRLSPPGCYLKLKVTAKEKHLKDIAIPKHLKQLPTYATDDLMVYLEQKARNRMLPNGGVGSWKRLKTKFQEMAYLGLVEDDAKAKVIVDNASLYAKVRNVDVCNIIKTSHKILTSDIYTCKIRPYGSINNTDKHFRLVGLYEVKLRQHVSSNFSEMTVVRPSQSVRNTMKKLIPFLEFKEIRSLFGLSCNEMILLLQENKCLNYHLENVIDKVNKWCGTKWQDGFSRMVLDDFSLSSSYRQLFSETWLSILDDIFFEVLWGEYHTNAKITSEIIYDVDVYNEKCLCLVLNRFYHTYQMQI